MDRPVIITGNWKMYKTADEAVEYVEQLIPLIKEATSKVYLAVPFTSINPTAEKADKTNLIIGAQNMHDSSEGAFTGEIAAKMLVFEGARFVLLGHSERRRYFNESNQFINRKVKRAVIDKIQPVLCIGENQEEHEAGKTEKVLQTQLTECLEDLSAEELKDLILAYEPVWAIGTDKTATPETVQRSHSFCRQFIVQKWGQEFADKLVIQYGGSVNPYNCQPLIDLPDVDGLLVGGASLSADSFSKIANIRKTTT